MIKKNKRIINILLVSLIILNIFVYNFKIINAQEENQTEIMSKLKTVAEEKAGYTTAEETSLRTTVATIVRFILGFLGIIFLILIIVGGYQWMTAGGNEETIAKAKKRIINATIGVAIVLLSYTITAFLLINILYPAIES